MFFFPFLCRVVRGSKLLLFGGASDDEQGSKEDDYRRVKFNRMSFLKSCCDPRKSQTSLILGPCLRSAFSFPPEPRLAAPANPNVAASITAWSASCEGRFGGAHKLDDVRKTAFDAQRLQVIDPTGCATARVSKARGEADALAAENWPPELVGGGCRYPFPASWLSLDSVRFGRDSGMTPNGRLKAPERRTASKVMLSFQCSHQ